MIKLKDITDDNISEVAESLIFYEKYGPVLDYLLRKKELWVNEDIYFQLTETQADYAHNPEFSAFMKYIGENGIAHEIDKNNHVRLKSREKTWVIWAYCTEYRIEKWCFDGVPIAYYYTGSRVFYVIVSDEDGTRQKVTANKAIRTIFG